MLCVYIQNCAPCVGGDDIFRKIMKQVVGKWKMEPKDLRRQVWWLYEEVWRGLEPNMLVFHWFYHYLLKGQRRPEDANRTKWLPSRGGFEVRKWDFWLNMLCVYIQKCVPHCSGEHIFTKIMKTCHRKMKNVSNITPDTWKYHHNRVGCIKTSLKLCRIHH